MGESGYANSSWSASAGYSASMLTEDAKVDSSSTRQLLPSSVNISAEYPALPDHDSMNNPSVHPRFYQCSQLPPSHEIMNTIISMTKVGRIIQNAGFEALMVQWLR